MAELKIKIPEGVQVSVSGQKVSASGKAGSSEREFGAKGVSIKSAGGEVVVACENSALAGTIAAHISNMIKGAGEGYRHAMQSIHSHFPLSLEVKGRQLLVKNFIGEKLPRTIDIVGDTKLEAKGNVLAISGPSKEHVGQTIANIKAKLRIRNRDPRVFQDGLYIVEE